VYVSMKKVAEGDQTSIVVTVKDEGVGMDTELLTQLFTKFVSKSEIGTGLGLFICKGIVEAHGGKIWAKNNPDGRGATFAFTIPRGENNLDGREASFTFTVPGTTKEKSVSS
ncbi:MAG: HAMP domain-containing sensor histidine kinase, partial [Nitrososphaeraceae archaeon]